MTDASVWFPIKNGPLLDAARERLNILDEARKNGLIQHPYRIGEERHNNGKREIQIVFRSEQDAVASALT